MRNLSVVVFVAVAFSCGARTELAGEVVGAEDGGAGATPHVCRRGSVGDGVTCVSRSALDELVSRACHSFPDREIFDARGACGPARFSSELYECCPSSCWSSAGLVNHGCEPIAVADGRAPALCQSKGMSVDYVHSYVGTDPNCGAGKTTTTFVSCCP